VKFPTEGDGVFFPVRMKLEALPLKVELPTFSVANDEWVRALLAESFDQAPAAVQQATSAGFLSARGLLRFLTHDPDLFLRIGAILFGKPESWVAANCTMAEILEVLVSFLSAGGGERCLIESVMRGRSPGPLVGSLTSSPSPTVGTRTRSSARVGGSSKNLSMPPPHACRSGQMPWTTDVSSAI
jgi:hypothetical protein